MISILSQLRSIGYRHKATKFVIRSLAHQTDCTNNNKSPVWAWNEWDPLEEVIVGVPDNAVVPKPSLEVAATYGHKRLPLFHKHAGKLFSEVMGSELWQKVVDDVDELARVLTAEGVKVVRPTAINYSTDFVTPNFSSRGMYASMPRDFLMVVGDEMIEATMTWRCRYFEYEAFRPLIRTYFEQGAKWTAAPKCTMEDGLYDKTYDIGQTEPYKYVVTELEPCFDAADFMRLGKDIFGQLSHVTNRAAIKWMRRQLAPRGIRVHEVEFDGLHPMHLDTNLIPVRPGLMLLKDQLQCRTPDLLEKSGWDVVRLPKPPHRDEHYQWMHYHGMPNNMLSIDTERVLVEKSEPYIADFMRGLGFKPIPVSLKHANFLGGGFHCWTTDVRRRGDLQSYFDWPQEILERCQDRY